MTSTYFHFFTSLPLIKFFFTPTILTYIVLIYQSNFYSLNFILISFTNSKGMHTPSLRFGPSADQLYMHDLSRLLI